MTLHNTPVRLNVHTLGDQQPHERFADAELGTDPQTQDRYQAMVVMEVWAAARGPEPAPVVTDTLSLGAERIDHFMALGQAWLWKAVVDPAVWVLVGDARVELAEALEEEGTRPLDALAGRIRHQRLGDGQYVALTLRELNMIRPIVEAIPEAYAEHDRLVPVIRSAWRDAAAEQHRRFRADREEIREKLRTRPGTWRWGQVHARA